MLLTLKIFWWSSVDKNPRFVQDKTMVKENKTITGDTSQEFVNRLRTAFEDGWVLVQTSMIVQEYFFLCVVEKEVRQLPPRLPSGW